MRRMLFLSVIFAVAVSLIFSGALSNNLASLILLRGVMQPEVGSALIDNAGWVEVLLTPSLSSNDPRVVEQSHRALGVAYEDAGNHRRALVEWRLGNAAPLWEHVSDLAWLSGNPAISIMFRQRAIDTAPDRFQNYFTLAWYYLPGLGRVADAIQVYSEAAAIAPPASFERYLAEGYVFQLQGQSEPALEKFEQALIANPSRADVHRLAANSALKVGNSQSAIAHLWQAIQLSPKDSFAYIELGDTYKKAGQPEQALFWYSEAVRVNLGNAFARVALGQLLLERKSFAEAIIELQVAIRLRPGIKEYHLLLAQSYEGTGQTPEALSQYRQALALDVNDTDALIALERLNSR